ncbi:MAG: hypothetical protein XXXJIFNMEKO3_00115 [Candidatus Erwinia impunctatus]
MCHYIARAYLFVAHYNYITCHTQLGETLRLCSTMRTGGYLALTLTNALMVFFSLGWCTPIAEIRHARFIAQHTALEGDLSLEDVKAHAETATSALGEEVVAAFDLNPGI